MEVIANGLKTHFQFKTMSFVGILEDQQRKFLIDFRQNKSFILKNSITEEKWAQVKVGKKDQQIASAITSLEQMTITEVETEDQKETGEDIDYIVSCSETSQGVKRQYKVVQSLLEFQKIIYEYITLARSFASLAPEASAKLAEVSSLFNELVCDDILGTNAVTNNKIQHITAKHLCKYYCYKLSNDSIFLFSTCIKLHFLRRG